MLHICKRTLQAHPRTSIELKARTTSENCVLGSDTLSPLFPSHMAALQVCSHLEWLSLAHVKHYRIVKEEETRKKTENENVEGFK